MTRGESADDEFWDVVFEASWRHHMGEPVGEMAFPSEEAASGQVGEPGVLTAAGGWCAPFDPHRVPVARSVPRAEADSVGRAAPEPVVPQLACGCPESILETGQHEQGCLVLEGGTLNHWSAYPELAARPPSCVIPSDAALADAFTPEDAPPPGEIEQRFRNALDRHREEAAGEPG